MSGELSLWSWFKYSRVEVFHKTSFEAIRGWKISFERLLRELLDFEASSRQLSVERDANGMGVHDSGRELCGDMMLEWRWWKPTIVKSSSSSSRSNQLISYHYTTCSRDHYSSLYSLCNRLRLGLQGNRGNGHSLYKYGLGRGWTLFFWRDLVVNCRPSWHFEFGGLRLKLYLLLPYKTHLKVDMREYIEWCSCRIIIHNKLRESEKPRSEAQQVDMEQALSMLTEFLHSNPRPFNKCSLQSFYVSIFQFLYPC